MHPAEHFRMIRYLFSVKRAELFSLGSFYLLMGMNVFYGLAVFYSMSKIYSNTFLNELVYFHTLALYLAMSIDFGLTMFGQRRAARRKAMGLSNTRLVGLEVAGRVPLALLVAVVTWCILQYVGQSSVFVFYVISFVLAAPFTINWLFLGHQQAQVPAAWMAGKLTVSLILIWFAGASAEVMTGGLAIIHLLATIGVFLSALETRSVAWLVMLRGVMSIGQQARFFRMRLMFGGMTLIDALIHFLPYFFIRIFAVDSPRTVSPHST